MNKNCLKKWNILILVQCLALLRFQIKLFEIVIRTRFFLRTSVTHRRRRQCVFGSFFRPSICLSVNTSFVCRDAIYLY